MDDPKATAVNFLFIGLFTFVVVFFLVPIKWVAMGFVIIGVAYSALLFKQSRGESDNKKKIYAIIVMVAALANYALAVQATKGLALSPLLISEIVDLVEATGMVVAIVLYTRWITILVIYVAIYLISCVIAFLTQSATINQITKYFGFLFFAVMVGVNLLEVFINITKYSLVIPILGMSIPYELWYTIEIGSWIIGGWTFITNILTELIENATQKSHED